MFASQPPATPSVLITGATHAREPISIQMTLYSLMSLLQGGIIGNNTDTKQMLSQNKYYFIPIINVDGVAYIEEDHVKTNHTMDILEKRKNMALAKTYGDSGKECNGVKSGVDLNRNWGYDYKLDFAQDREDEPGRYDPCSEFYAGPSAFSEKET